MSENKNVLIEFRHVDKEFDKPEEGMYKVVGDLNIQVRENEFWCCSAPDSAAKARS